MAKPDREDLKHEAEYAEVTAKLESEAKDVNYDGKKSSKSSSSSSSKSKKSHH